MDRISAKRMIGVAVFGFLFFGLYVAMAGTPELVGPAEYKAAAGPFRVETATYEWTDPKRGREVPVKLYFPGGDPGPFPVIVFSHGLGGTREGYEYLGRHWASHGYVSIHLQHKGSDDSVWRGKERPLEAMRDAAADWRNSVNRPLDVRFTIDRLERLREEEGPLKGRLDLDRIGAAGHSFGAYTTLAVAGQVFVGRRGKGAALRDSRVKAAIPMSAPVPGDRKNLERSFGGITIPCLHMTGTRDNSSIGRTTAAERRLPFDHINGADQYLIVFRDGDHMVFSGRRRLRQRAGKRDARFHELIRMSTTAFWDAYLKDDAKARAWLAEGGFKSVLASDGTFEKKLPSK